ncbi:MAG: sensor domain-containing diguanylate cyclase [Sulfurimonas sp.]|uniref:sensor domain-containing diguanylate cyclase n=1 Tax=Sulfurimonas sp. TaxID=2022749 RepID=UPI00260AD383|nr:sensor domain-containing diguanylate cyclase [Sulfurimonas sp.]MDD5373129.1 sensor domain-containing diguanylate cyclase [Sulfurimonas sp.]
MYNDFRRAVLFFVFFVFAVQINAMEVIKVNDKTQKIGLSEYSELFFDAQNHFSYEDVSKDLFNDNFKSVKSESSYVGYTNDTAWMRFSILNDAHELFEGKIEIPVSWMSGVSFYIKKGEELNVTNLSPAFSSKVGEVYAKSLFLPITIEPSQNAIVYIKVKSKGALTLAPQLYSQKKAIERLTYINILNGALIGIVFIMLLYNVNNYLRFKDKNYLYFVLYLVSLFFLMGVYYGYGIYPFSKNGSTYNENVSLAMSAFTFFTGLLFTKSFLNVDRYLPSSERYFFTLLLFSALIGCFGFIMGDSLISLYIVMLFSLISFLFLIFVSAFSLHKKISGSIYLLLAWLSLALGTLLSLMSVLGFIHYYDHIYNFYAFSVILNIIMISFALTSRVEDIEMQFELEVKKEHEVADRLNLSKKELRELNEKLERKIQSQERELLAKNKENEKFSVKDEVTQLYNKAKLEEVLTNELHRSKRYLYKFSVIVINIDGMKAINDTHGYQVGNSVMKEMADLIMRNIRYLDTIGRWSESEYLVICPEIDAENGVIVAQHLQKLIEKSKFFFVGRATACFGVTGYHVDDTMQDIMKRGYEALAIAKEGGRNRVEML